MSRSNLYLIPLGEEFNLFAATTPANAVYFDVVDKRTGQVVGCRDAGLPYLWMRMEIFDQALAQFVEPIQTFDSHFGALQNLPSFQGV